MEFAEQIKCLRKESNLTQEEIAKKLNVTRQAISNWENNINEPKISYIIRLCNYFDVSADYILGLKDE